VGIALSDEGGQMAFPEIVLPNDGELLSRIEVLVAQKHVVEIVIGHSKHSDGSDNPLQSLIEAFITDLTLHIGIPVHLEPEQYTTQEAIRFQGRTEMTDAAAAAVILNSYLTHTK
ncbi:MAG: RuvX/YqgF family protein, partial [Bacteroidota bacterium]